LGRSCSRTRTLRALLSRKSTGAPSVPPSQTVRGRCCCQDARRGCRTTKRSSARPTDLRWKVALGLELRRESCAPKSTLAAVSLRAKAGGGTRSTGQIFEGSVTTCRRRPGWLKAAQAWMWRIDNPRPVLGRGAVKDTYNLISDQIRTVVQEACRRSRAGSGEGRVINEAGAESAFPVASLKGGPVELDWDDPAGAARALIGQVVAGCAAGRWPWQAARVCAGLPAAPTPRRPCAARGRRAGWRTLLQQEH